MRGLLIGFLLALAGCGPASDEPGNVAENRAVELPRGPMLGEVDLSRPISAAGTAPYWEMGIAPGRITHRTGADAPVDFYPVSPRVADGRAVYSTRTPEGEKVTVTLVLEPCGTADATLPLTAQVRIGARAFDGCAGPGPGGEPQTEAANAAG